MSLSRFDEAAKSFLELLADVVDMRSPASSVGVYFDFHLFVFSSLQNHHFIHHFRQKIYHVAEHVISRGIRLTLFWKRN